MGKVHGSLARAGKVRGQTPKVAKQDKKKKPRGRAHKRMQYNRRFVTAGQSGCCRKSLSTLLWFEGLEEGVALALFSVIRTWILWSTDPEFVGFGKKRGPNSSEK
ncbi:hypothetical protein DKX38_021418 [Salix brachista]|uniref:Uncharacterized protein n=1 Tax=Salix brachista TaxID=2182728 RepID=A0A5N5K7M0_9ROSI|nr:hypothetical protein DKX38_021418 [Salix brachista]